MTTARHIVTLLKSHIAGDEDRFLNQTFRFPFCLSMIFSEKRHPLFGSCSRRCFGVSAEIGGGDGFVAPQFGGLAA
jgi:hypothetical protein